MKFALENKNDLIRKYVDELKSTHVIAKEYNTNNVRVMNALKFLGIQLRNRSQSQKIALENGRSNHPTLGTVRDEKTKLKISESTAKYYENLSEDDKLAISIRAREKWQSFSDETKQRIQESAGAAIRLAAKNGSSIEKFVHIQLVKSGFDCEHHRKILENEKLEVDLFLPSLRVVIEIDGPSHFLPIWGEESLNRHIKADKEKDALLIQKNFTVIRVRVVCNSMSRKRGRDLITGLVTVLNRIEKNPVAEVIYLEV